MDMSHFRTYLIYFIFVGMLFPATHAFAADIVFESDVQIKRNSLGNLESIKTGDLIKLAPGENIFVSTPQGLPMLIYSVQKDSSKVTVSNIMISTAVQEQLQPALEKSTAEIIEGLRRAEVLVQKRELNQAATITNSLKEKYKYVSSIWFLSGTIAFLQNSKTTAIEDLEKGLRLDPDNDPAKKLLTKLKGAP